MASITPHFGTDSDTIVKSGIIPIKIEHGCVYAYTMIPSSPEFGGTSPQMAKGNVDDGENTIEAAIREGTEEIGLVKSNIKRMEKIGVAYYMDFGVQLHVFACVLHDNDDWDTPGYEAKSTQWVNITRNLDSVREQQRVIFRELLDKNI